MRFIIIAPLVCWLRAEDDIALLQASSDPHLIDHIIFRAESTEAGIPEHKPLREILQMVGQHARRLSDAGRRPAFVHIGAANFGNTERWADVDLYRHVQEGLRSAGVPEHGYGLHAVEPRKAEHHALQRQMWSLGLYQDGDTSITGALISGTCSGPTVDFYGPSEATFKYAMQNIGHWNTIDSWSSTDPTFFKGVVEGLIANPNQTNTYAVGCAKEIISIQPDKSEWTEARPIRCLAPRELLETVGADERTVPMLVVDAEGADMGIVREFLKLDDFAPTLIQFEGQYSALLMEKHILKTLLQKGYAVGKISEGSSGDASNIYAVRLPAPRAAA